MKQNFRKLQTKSNTTSIYFTIPRNIIINLNLEQGQFIAITYNKKNNIIVLEAVNNENGLFKSKYMRKLQIKNNSASVSFNIPRDIVKDMGLIQGQFVNVTNNNNKIIVKPIKIDN